MANDGPLADSFLFLFLSMIIIAASLYLPEHIMTMLSRAWFYYAGDDTVAARGASGTSNGAIPGGLAAGSSGQGMEGALPRMPGQDVMDLLGTL